MEEVVGENNEEEEQQDVKKDVKKDDKKDDKKEDKKENDQEKKNDEKSAMEATVGGEQNKEIDKLQNELPFNGVTSFLKKMNHDPQRYEDKLDENTKKVLNESYYVFYCGKKNEATNLICEAENLSCPNCMKNNQKLYGLKSSYLINDRGRVCSFKHGKIYCNVQLIKEENKKGIIYSYPYVCGHSGQCDACERLTPLVDKYYDAKTLEKLRERDKKYYVN